MVWGIRHWFFSDINPPKKPRKKTVAVPHVEEGFKDKIVDPMQSHYGIKIDSNRSQKDFLEYANSRNLADPSIRPTEDDYMNYMNSVYGKTPKVLQRPVDQGYAAYIKNHFESKRTTTPSEAYQFHAPYQSDDFDIDDENNNYNSFNNINNNFNDNNNNNNNPSTNLVDENIISADLNFLLNNQI